MNLAWKRLTVYLRLTVIVAVVGAIGLVLFQNRNYRVRFWFFGLADETKEINVVWLIVSTATMTRLIWSILAFCSKMWRDLREVRKQEAQRRVDEDFKRRETELAQREARLNQNVIPGTVASVDAEQIPL
ncbi:MAG: hypothetical protein HY287_12800 [Planctomycetes bacterium]|nr:hypothetical protein [Planctomycetota bacterium]MBI3835202.1 hypothetical protein [Planctomycetota bacterium]